MVFVRSSILRHLYNRGSLKNTSDGFTFSLKNRLGDFQVEQVLSLKVGDREIPREQVFFDAVPIVGIQPGQPFAVVLGHTAEVRVEGAPLAPGSYALQLVVKVHPYGRFALTAEDSLHEPEPEAGHIPRDDRDDYQPAIIQARHEFLRQQTGQTLQHISGYSIDPEVTRGNIEHFIGVAQVPMGLCGPILVHGEHAQGEFLVPLATSEGTLVASYNRGIKVLNLCGGVTTTVVDDCMQRAPVFTFESARGARDFVAWVQDHLEEIRQVAEATSSVAKLLRIESYQAIRFAYLRFNFSTGDAAGQNMVGRATFAACNWILDHYHQHPVDDFYLEANMATDKKSSMLNILQTRGKRVTAECLIRREVLREVMRCDTETLLHHSQVAAVGSFLAGVNNTGCHSANAVAALFIATGQDVANVAESSTAILHSELTDDKDLYMSVTLPSLVVATHGGGTGLPTQRESLELLGCFGKGKVKKLAEIIAGVVLAGELSLASAISSYDWVSSHERMGRHR